MGSTSTDRSHGMRPPVGASGVVPWARRSCSVRIIAKKSTDPTTVATSGNVSQARGTTSWTNQPTASANGSVTGYLWINLWPTEEVLEQIEAIAVHELHHNLRYANRVWDPATVTVHVGRLRQKLETNPERPRWIVTAWGIGYRFEP